jgi:hypothetical protein
MRFLAESAGGWEGEDFVAWCHDTLFPGRFVSLRKEGATTFHIQQTGAGVAELPTPPRPFPYGDRAALVPMIVSIARARVLDALRLLTLREPDDHFVRDALYSGRVVRAGARGRQSTWEPKLKEGEQVSQWVLGLFAADALTDRDRYDHRLYVCDRCQSVGFGDGSTRSLCPQHALEAFDIARRRRSSRPPAPIAGPSLRSRGSR